jgi:hypothetical protein
MDQKMNIPTIGTLLTLGKEWTFTAVAEYRNRGLMDYLTATGVVENEAPRYIGSGRDYARYECTLPRGTRLRVDRIYIRKGAPDFDSLTFWALDLGSSGSRTAFAPKNAVRFWAKLADVNTMVVTDKLEPARKAKPLPIRAILLRE